MSYQLDIQNFARGPETWIKKEREGYRLFVVEDLSNGPSEIYAIAQYDWQDREIGDIISIGRGEFHPIELDKDAVLEEMENRGITPFTDKQWETVRKAYEKLVRIGMDDSVLDHDLQIYKNTIYFELDDLNKSVQYYVDNIHDRLDKYEETKDKPNKTVYDNHKEAHQRFGRLGDDQYHNLDVLEAGVNPPHSEKVPYAQHCNCVATLRIEELDGWELRAIELLHNGVLINKPELAKTKALLEEGCSQAEIAEKLCKSASTVSRQVSQIEDWEQRAEWQVRQ